MIVFEIFKETISVVVFVLVMMLLIEYLTVQSKGKLQIKLKENTWMQIIFAALMGLIPGCLGTFAVVSMYIHRTIALPALVTALIATSGDEAFVMFSMIPDSALLIMLSVFAISIITGFVLNIFLKNKTHAKKLKNHNQYHSSESECQCFEKKALKEQFKKIVWQRAVLITIGLAYALFLIFGDAGHEHFKIDLDHGHHHDHGHSGWGWERITFLIVTIIGLYIVTTVPDHFIKEHLWGHVIKKHFLKLLLWTLGAFIILHFLNEYIDFENWIRSNMQIVILIAVLVGIIPESGPHIIFISLFAGGLIPFSVLLANSIVQDGHGAIPLLAESGKSFIIAKLINVLVGLLIGYLLLFAGF